MVAISMHNRLSRARLPRTACGLQCRNTEAWRVHKDQQQGERVKYKGGTGCPISDSREVVNGKEMA